jgi:hypothetical protein
MRAWEDSVGADARREVLGLADRGYDDPQSEPAIAAKGGHCIIALGTTRRVKSAALPWTPPPSRQWCHLDTFVRRHRRRKGHPRRLPTPGNKRQRRALRVRHPAGSLRDVGQVAVGGAARRTRPDGRRQSLACNDLRATARQMVRGYRRRWAVELFPQSVKQHLGFEDVATQGFDAVRSHIHGVDCASILLPLSPPGLSPGSQSIGAKQRALQHGLADPEKRHILQQLTHIGGVQRSKDELRPALAGA